LKGDTFYTYTKERAELEAEIDKRIRDIALYLGRYSLRKAIGTKKQI